jgi:hypothetical protein
MTTWHSVDEQSASVKIYVVGDNARFVFLEMFRAVVFLDITSRQADKVYQLTPEDKELVSVRPLMLIWPPVFPPMKEGCDQKDSCTVCLLTPFIVMLSLIQFMMFSFVLSVSPFSRYDDS